MSTVTVPSFQRRAATVSGRTILLAVFFVIEMATLGLLVPGWLTLDGLLDTSRIFIESGLLALGMTFVIITGGIDLSVASLLALVSVVIGFSHQVGLPLPLAMLLGVGTGVGCGLLNGAIVAYLGLHPLVVTLATMALFRGAAYVISNAAAYSAYPDWFTTIGGYYIGGVVPAQLSDLRGPERAGLGGAREDAIRTTCLRARRE